MSAPIRVGILGLGVMGRTHLAAYRAAASDGYPCSVVALADHHIHELSAEPRSSGNLKGEHDKSPSVALAGARPFLEAEELFADPAVDLVSICTPTDTHVPLCIAAMESGKDVLVEKPLALTAADALKVVEVERSTGRLCVPAMCMRFWPGWPWLRDRIIDGSLGALRSLILQRVGSRPGWSKSFYHDETRSGGALFDLHIHDADLLLWALGDPSRVFASGAVNHCSVSYLYGDSPAPITAEGGWGQAEGFPFRMKFLANFEHATADWEFGRTPLLMLARDGRWEPVELPSLGAYDGEVRHVLDALRARREGRHFDLLIRSTDGVRAAELLAAERASLDSGKIEPVRLSPR